MNRKLLRVLKSFAVVAVVFVLIHKVVFQDVLVGMMRSSLMFRGPGMGFKDTSMGTRKLLGNTGLWNAFTNSSSLNNTDHRLPTCIIIGVRKCGTRALLEFLNLHPKIVASPDEMHFFSNDTNYMKGLGWYRSKMPLSSADQITIEKTPRYFVSRAAPARIHRMNNSIKLIVILRHPTTRVISDFTQIYTQKLARNATMKEFELTAIDFRTGHVNLDYKALQISVYHQHISRWLDIFPNSQLHIADGENLLKNPISELSKVETFLGLKHAISAKALYYNITRGFYCMRQSDKNPKRCLGANKGRKHVYISDWARTKLNNFFKPHNEILFKIIGRRFLWR